MLRFCGQQLRPDVESNVLDELKTAGYSQASPKQYIIEQSQLSVRIPLIC